MITSNNRPTFYIRIISFIKALFSKNLFYYLHIDMMEDVIYGNHERNKMNIFIPKSASGEIGLVLVIHGGSFVSGDKMNCTRELQKWSKRGYIAAALNYRYVDKEHTINAQLEDITSALLKIKEICAERNIHANKVLLAGESSGAHVAMLYASSMKNAAPITPTCVLDRCGSVDLSAKTMMLGISGQEEKWRFDVFSNLIQKRITTQNWESEDIQSSLKKISAVSYLSESGIPTVICHSPQDNMVPFEQAKLLDKILTDNGTKHDLVVFEHSGHGLSGNKEASKKAEMLIEKYAKEFIS